MMISKLCSLLFETTKDYKHNLQTLLHLIKECPTDALVVAGEVCLTGYDYENFEAMLDFADEALPKLLEASTNKTVILTLLERDGDGAKNFAYVLHNGKVVHKQAKAKLFKFGDEHRYIDAGDEEDIVIFEVGGVQVGILICFELRFKKLWMCLEGADIIVVPSWWGKLREQNYLTLTNALAVINECYLVCSDNLNKECNAQSGIISPFGVEERNNKRAILEWDFDKNEIKKMRRYMDIGIGAK
ncbi:Aliphatic amidase AmiE [hydrothermal vent metagenome]|uniref:Aliphatic amidase AmiE n=1 Tax=hydrothermal vent metagenome TaxID=652676 RepID=A0A1W1C1V4_9ZZZZ